MKEVVNNFKRGNWIPKFLTPALMALLLVQAVKVTDYMKDIESRTLDSIEIKVRLQDHIKIWTPLAQHQAFERLSNAEVAVRKLKASDSISLLDRKEIKATLHRIEKTLSNFN